MGLSGPSESQGHLPKAVVGAGRKPCSNSVIAPRSLPSPPPLPTELCNLLPEQKRRGPCCWQTLAFPLHLWIIPVISAPHSLKGLDRLLMPQYSTIPRFCAFLKAILSACQTPVCSSKHKTQHCLLQEALQPSG